MRAAALALPLLLALPALAPPAGAGHVPLSATIIELPESDALAGGWVCWGTFLTTRHMQVADTCELWCATDGGCAIFYTDFDYATYFPFEVTFNHTDGSVARRSSAEYEDHVCIYWWEMADLHYTFHPSKVAPGTLGHAFGVKDEGQFCPPPY